MDKLVPLVVSRLSSGAGSNARHSCSVAAHQSQSRGLGGACARTHSSGRETSDSEGDASKVEITKRKHSVHAYFRRNQKRSILRAEKYGDLDNNRAQNPQRRKDVNLGTITDTLPWYKFSPLSGRRIYESFQSRRRSRKSFVRTIYQNLARFVKNYHGIIEQLHLINQRQPKLQDELYVK